MLVDIYRVCVLFFLLLLFKIHSHNDIIRHIHSFQGNGDVMIERRCFRATRG